MHYSNEHKMLVFLGNDYRQLFSLPVSVVIAEDIRRPRLKQIAKLSAPTRTDPPKLVMRNKGDAGVEVLLATTEGTFNAVDVKL